LDYFALFRLLLRLHRLPNLGHLTLSRPENLFLMGYLHHFRYLHL
jgi:hypothetical protein